MNVDMYVDNKVVGNDSPLHITFINYPRP